jgi:hypothetical protein
MHSHQQEKDKFASIKQIIQSLDQLESGWSTFAQKLSKNHGR